MFDPSRPFVLAALTAFVFAFIGNLIRYGLITGAAYQLFYRTRPTAFDGRAIVPPARPPAQNARDLKYSLMSMAIYGLVGIVMVALRRLGAPLTIYEDIGEFGWGYWWVSIGLMLVAHDTYFYWTHRLMHHPKLFRIFHRVHHLSRNPTPLTNYAFHPTEAVVEASVAFVFFFAFPVHISALAVFMFIQFGYNTLGHLGYELYPAWFVRSPLGKLFNTTSHHHQHHQTFNYNYGLYFNVWDRLCGTNHPKYQEFFEKNASSQPLETREATASK